MGRESECDGKTKYPTKGKALERLHHQMDNRKRLKRQSRGYRHLKMEVYHCRHCGQWHVGSTIDPHIQWMRQMKVAAVNRLDAQLRRLARERNRVGR